MRKYSLQKTKHQMRHNSQIQNKQLHYFGHLIRMQDDRYPKIACNSCVHGVRSRGRPKKRLIDWIREDCKELKMTLKEATHFTRDRRVWRATIDDRLMRATASSGRAMKKKKVALLEGLIFPRGVQSPKPMVHIAYFAYFRKIYKLPLFSFHLRCLV